MPQLERCFFTVDHLTIPFYRDRSYITPCPQIVFLAKIRYNTFKTKIIDVKGRRDTYV